MGVTANFKLSLDGQVLFERTLELFFESELQIPCVKKQCHDIENENLLIENANGHNDGNNIAKL